MHDIIDEMVLAVHLNFRAQSKYTCLLASVHEDFELHSADPGVVGVVSDVPGPDLAVHRDHDAGGQVVELNEYVWAEKVSNPRKHRQHMYITTGRHIRTVKPPVDLDLG